MVHARPVGRIPGEGAFPTVRERDRGGEAAPTPVAAVIGEARAGTGPFRPARRLKEAPAT